MILKLYSIQLLNFLTSTTYSQMLTKLNSLYSIPNPNNLPLLPSTHYQISLHLFNNQTQILPLSKNEPMRILGIHLSQNSIIAPGRIKIKQDLITITNSLKNKFTTPQIATYIYNKVLLPRIEYKLQTTFLTSNLLLSYQRIIDSTIKHKYSIERTLLQKLYQNPYLFQIKPLS